MNRFGLLLVALLAGCGAKEHRVSTPSSTSVAQAAADWVQQGEVHFVAGEYRQALVFFERAVKENANDRRAWLDIGLANEALLQVPAAEKAYLRALEIDLEFAEALNNLGVLSREQGDLAQAERYLRKALVARPTFADAHFNLAMALEDKGEHQQATASYLRTAELSKDDALPWLNLGMLKLSLGQKAEALRYLNEASAYASDAQIRVDIGQGLRMAGDPQAAQALLSGVIRDGHSGVRVHSEFALAMYAAGNLKGATEALQNALSIEPNNATTHYLLGGVYLKRKKTSLARNHLKRSIELDTDGRHAAKARQKLKALR